MEASTPGGMPTSTWHSIARDTYDYDVTQTITRYRDGQRRMSIHIVPPPYSPLDPSPPPYTQTVDAIVTSNDHHPQDATNTQRMAQIWLSDKIKQLRKIIRELESGILYVEDQCRRMRRQLKIDVRSHTENGVLLRITPVAFDMEALVEDFCIHIQQRQLLKLDKRRCLRDLRMYGDMLAEMILVPMAESTG